MTAAAATEVVKPLPGHYIVRLVDKPESNSMNLVFDYISSHRKAFEEELAELLRIPFAYTAKVIYNLHKSGLVELAAPVVKAKADLVPTALLDRVTGILTEVIGPMAPLVLRDQIEALGASPDSLPEAKLDDLIMLIGREIGDGKLKNKFEESMFQEISNFKRF